MRNVSGTVLLVAALPALLSAAEYETGYLMITDYKSTAAIKPELGGRLI
jgi:hypothetical protein